MRICLYSETALPVVGGQELVIDALARQYLAGGHDVVVVALEQRRRGPPSDDHSLPYPVVRHRRFFSTRYLLDFYCRYLSQIYRKHRCDVIHCHNVYPAGYVAAHWSESQGVPLVITSHGCDISPDSHLLTKPQVPGRVAYVLGQAAGLVAISDAVERQYRRHCPQASRIVRISNGVDLSAYATPAPRGPGIPSSLRPQGYFLFLGRLVRRKGGDLLLEAFRQIADQVAAHLVIAGAGAEAAALKTMAIQLGLAGRVHFPGVVQGVEKLYLLQNCLGVVVPSRISEASSLVVLESHAAGAPVIGTRIPGLADSILHNETGILVPPDNARELAAAMVRLANHRELASLVGQNGRAEAEQRDWRAVAEQHLDLYASLRAGRVQRKSA